MNIFVEPVNIKQWNIFEKVKEIGHVEPFLATKEMRYGDLMLLHVGQQDKAYESGIYAIGKVLTEPFILTNHPDDYCNNKRTVNVEIIQFNFDKPYITHKECKTFINQFRTANKIDESYYEEILYKIGFHLKEESISEEYNDKIEVVENIDKEVDTLGILGEERLAYIKVRVNQSVFREQLLRRYKHCCLCNVSDEALLRASHIKPWSESNANEKLDVDNGLILCPNHDVLFDQGFISFNDEGKILISDILSENDRMFMNVNPNMEIKLTEGNKEYMYYHRKKIFKK